MLSFEEKLAIIDTFSELERKQVSLGRVNYHYENSVYDKKTVVYHLHPNGNGFVYAGKVSGYETDDKGLVNIRDYSAEDLKKLVAEAIRSLSESSEETWVGPNDSILSVTYEEEEDLWFVYAGENIDSAFETYEELEEYMAEEGFRRK